MIVIISGSPRKEQSKTGKYAKMIAAATGEPYKIYEAGTWHIDYCTGCEKCLEEGRCINGNDDYYKIYEDLRCADAIIFASPVYCGHITGQMKTLFDRMMTELHVMPFIGKPAIALALSSRSYQQESADYLKMILEYCGASVISSLAIKNYADKDETERMLTEASALLKKAIASDYELTVSNLTRTAFARTGAHYRIMAQLNAKLDFFPAPMGEVKMWEKQGYMKYKSIDDLLNEKHL